VQEQGGSHGGYAARAQGGDILALHDGVLGPHQAFKRESTLRHLPVLLSALRERGLEIDTVASVLSTGAETAATAQW
jgi:hypothetical protein